MSVLPSKPGYKTVAKADLSSVRGSIADARMAYCCGVVSRSRSSLSCPDPENLGELASHAWGKDFLTSCSTIIG